MNVESPDARFDLRLRMGEGPLAIDSLVACHEAKRPAGTRQVRELAKRTRRTTEHNHLPYQAILVARTGFTKTAHTAAAETFVRLITYEELLDTLVNFEHNLDAAIRDYQGTALERLYVEQEVVLQGDLLPGDDGALKVWDAESGRNIHNIETTMLYLQWLPAGHRLAVATRAGTIDIWDFEAKHPKLLARLHNIPGTGLASTPDGYVSGPAEALEYVRFADGLALYDLEDLPERISTERVQAALKRP